MRNQNPFTDRQIRLLEAIREKIRHIHDPNPEIITDESYEWFTESTRQFGTIPKLRFSPQSSRIKAELIRDAGLIDELRENEYSQIRQKYGIKEARNRKARLFESEWNNIMLKVKKAMFTAGYINQLLATDQQSVAEPIAIIQQIVTDEYAPQIKGKRQAIHPNEEEAEENTEKDKIKGYDNELEEME